MEEVKYYGAADLYDPTRPAREIPAALSDDDSALGRNLRAWMRSRVKSKTSNSNTMNGPSAGTLTTKPTTLNSSTSPRNITHPSKATFISVPGEIRNTVYRLILFPNHPLFLVLYCSHPRDLFRSLLRNPLFRVSHQIRAEAFSFLSTAKDFRIHDLRAATTFFHYLGPIGRANLTNVTITLYLCHVNVEYGRKLLRLMRDVRGPGPRRVRILMLDRVPLSEAWKKLMKEMKEALKEGCEEMEVQWVSAAGIYPS